MAGQFCSQRLEGFVQLVRLHGTLMSNFCILNLVFSLVTTLANLLVIRALWKATSVPSTLKKLFLSLSSSDLAVGLFVQLMLGVIIAMMLKMTAVGNYNFDFFCPTALTAFYFVLFLFASASFLNVTAIAVDRLLAISLHLRYQELVTSKRVIVGLLFLWFTSVVAASIYISLPNSDRLVVAIMGFAGLLLTSVAYIHIYKVVRYHQNQIQCHLQISNAQASELLREKKSALNTLFVYVVFIACYLPHLCTTVLLIKNSSQISFRAASHITFNCILLNSSLNPLVYCWRYREIRKIVKSTVKNIFRMSEV